MNKISLTDEEKFSALLFHIQHGRVGLVQVLLRAGTDTNRIDNTSGHTALTIAIRSYKYDMIAVLLAAGAEPNVKSRSAIIPLHLAVSLRYEPAIDALVAGNADAHLLDMSGQSCLDLAYPDEKLLNKLGGRLATYVPTDAVAKERRIKEGIIDILRSCYTVWWRCRNSDAVKLPATATCMLGTLGHCLLFIGEPVDAITCFENQPDTIDCDGCPGDQHLCGKRFVCGSCADTDLCEPCKNLQKSKAPPLPSCKEHDFLEIARPWLVKYGRGRINNAGETFREWLMRLAQCYLDEDDYEKLRKELKDEYWQGKCAGRRA